MNRTFLLVAIPWLFGVSHLFAKSELETLRSRCAEQERQIRQLEDENAKLRSLTSLAASRSSDKTTLPSVAAAAAVKTANTSSTYTVRADDTVERVSRKLGITPTALAAMNGLKATSTLHEGQKLKVPGSGPAAEPVAAATPSASAATPSAGSAAVTGKTHQMKQGETFTSVGKKYGISVATLIEANPGVNPSALRPGQVIQLAKSAQTAAAAEKSPAAAEKASATEKAPASEKASNSETAPAPEKAEPRVPAPQKKATPEPEKAGTSAAATHKAPSPAPVAGKKAGSPTPSGSAPAGKSNIRSVIIDGTTTYGEFAAKHGTNVSRLNDLNALDLVETTVLAKGSELYIPTQP